MRGGLISKDSDLDHKVSFIGFVNEFDDVFGKNCVYIHLDDTEDKEWLAERAVRHGALAVIAERQIGELPCIIVDDVWGALAEISLWYYQKKRAATTVVAGSIGKTTTKEMIACVYRRKFRTFCTPNNGNVLAYLAFEIQHMPNNVQQFVQEIDESYPNNADYCSYVLQPEIAVITTIDMSHVGAIGGEAAVEKAILDVANCVPDSGTIIINKDDPKSHRASFRQNVLSIAIHDQPADCFASDIVSGDTSVDFIIHYLSESVPIHLNCPGEHNVYNAMFAFLAGKLNGMDNKLIQKGLADYRPMTIRQRTYHSAGKKLYVDCYNSSAKSVKVALAVLDDMKTTKRGRRVAVLGDIAEIEGFEKQTYGEIASAIDGSKLDALITYGQDSAQISENVKRALMKRHFAEEKDLISFLKSEPHRGDVILFKASHSMNMENVVKKVFPFAYYWGKIPYWMKLGKWIVSTI